MAPPVGRCRALRPRVGGVSGGGGVDDVTDVTSDAALPTNQPRPSCSLYSLRTTTSPTLPDNFPSLLPLPQPFLPTSLSPYSIYLHFHSPYPIALLSSSPIPLTFSPPYPHIPALPTPYPRYSLTLIFQHSPTPTLLTPLPSSSSTPYPLPS